MTSAKSWARNQQPVAIDQPWAGPTIVVRITAPSPEDGPTRDQARARSEEPAP